MRILAKTVLSLFLASISINFISCATSRKTVDYPPDIRERFFNYHSKGKKCGTGMSRPHIKGVSYQRATAISRAIDEIARQQGVEVKTDVEHFLTGSEDNVRSGLSTYSIQTTSGKTVQATIIDQKFNTPTDEFIVLMCLD